MAAIEPNAAWNAYYDTFGFEPSAATQLQKFSRSPAAQHVNGLSFKDAQTIFKCNKGKGRIDALAPSNNPKSSSPPNNTPKKVTNYKIIPRAKPPKLSSQKNKAKPISIKPKKAPSNTKEIRSTLNNDPNDLSLDSILEILGRATLLKKQQTTSYDSDALNYGISVQLLHLGLTNGPLFPNTVLKWKKLQFLENGPTPRTGHVAAFINGKMVIFGGYAKQMLTDHIFLVDINGFDDNKSLEVTAISSLEKVHKTYRVGHSGVALSHSLYLFGGWNDEQYINHGLLFYVDSLKLVDERSKDRILPAPRRDHTLCQMGSGGLLLFGGWSHDYDGNELWLLGGDWKWQQLNVTGTAPCPRRGHSANVIGSHMYIFGGLYGFTKYLNDLHIYNGDKSEWIQPQLVGITKPPPRAWHTCNTIGKQILLFGGTAGRTNFLNDCWVFDTTGYFWFQIQCHTPSPLPRCSHSMVNVLQDQEFMNSAFTKECIKSDDQHSKIRLAFIMFGGLVAIDEKEKEKEKDLNEENKLIDDVKADIYKQHKVEEKKGTLKDIKGLKVSVNENFSSDSEQEEEMEHVNRIELSDDLYVLTLEI